MFYNTMRLKSLIMPRDGEHTSRPAAWSILMPSAKSRCRVSGSHWKGSKGRCSRMTSNSAPAQLPSLSSLGGQGAAWVGTRLRAELAALGSAGEAFTYVWGGEGGGAASDLGRL